MKFNFENYRVRTYDRMNLVVEEYREVKKKGKNQHVGESTEEWMFVGYYHNLDNAVDCLLERLLRNINTSTLTELKEAVDGLRKQLRKEINNV